MQEGRDKLCRELVELVKVANGGTINLDLLGHNNSPIRQVVWSKTFLLESQSAVARNAISTFYHILTTLGQVYDPHFRFSGLDATASGHASF